MFIKTATVDPKLRNVVVTASLTEIKDTTKGFADRIKKAGIDLDPGAHIYVRNHSCHEEETWGPNGNWDAIPRQEMTAHYHTFRGVRSTIDHLNEPEAEVGSVLDTHHYPVQPQTTGQPVVGGYVTNVIALKKARLEAYHAGLTQAILDGSVTDTSMGLLTQYTVCHVPTTLITMGDGTVKPIEEVQIGDEVITHNGNVRKVTQTFERDYDGLIYSIRSIGKPDPLLCTPEHPLLLSVPADVSYSEDGKPCPICGEDHKQLRSHIWQKHPEYTYPEETKWVNAEDVRHSYSTLFPKLKREIRTEASSETIAWARLLGYYLAEGSLWSTPQQVYGDPSCSSHDLVECPVCGEYYKYMGMGTHIASAHPDVDRTQFTKDVLQRVEFYFHADEEDFIKEVETLSRQIDPECHITIRKNGEKCVVILVYSKTIAGTLLELGGKNARTKRLSSEVFSWDDELLCNLLGAYINGDGHQAKNENRGRLQVDSASQNLLQQFYAISILLGMYVRLGKHIIKLDGRIFEGHTLYWNRASISPLTRYCSKIHTVTEKAYKHVADKYQHTNIRDIHVLSYKGKVYNLAVEDDESYIANLVSVHNCSVCGNRATSVADFCDHIAHYKGQMFEVDGVPKRAYESCREIAFFEDAIILPPHLGGKAGGRGADSLAKLTQILANSQIDVTPNNMESYLNAAMKYANLLEPTLSPHQTKLYESLMKLLSSAITMK